MIAGLIEGHRGFVHIHIHGARYRMHHDAGRWTVEYYVPASRHWTEINTAANIDLAYDVVYFHHKTKKS